MKEFVTEGVALNTPHTVWFASVSKWSGMDKLRPEDIGKEPEDILDIIQLGSKKLLPEDIRVNLQKPRSQLTALMDRMGRHFMHFRGAWLIPDSRFLLVRDGVDQIQKNMDLIVQDLIDNMPSIKEEMIESYPILQDADWPTDEQIKKRFKIKVSVCQVSGVEWNEKDVEELAEAKEKARQELQEEMNEYKDLVLIEAKKAIMESCQEISEKIENSDKITENSLKKPKRVIEDYLSIAEVFDIDDVKEVVRELKEKLDNTEAADLRNSFEIAQAFAENMKNISKDIGDLSGIGEDGQVKRKVKREEQNNETE